MAASHLDSLLLLSARNLRLRAVKIFYTEKIISKKVICSPLGYSMKQIAFRSEPFCDNQKRMKLTEKENIPCMSPQIHIMIWNVFLISYWPLQSFSFYGITIEKIVCIICSARCSLLLLSYMLSYFICKTCTISFPHKTCKSLSVPFCRKTAVCFWVLWLWAFLRYFLY